MKPVFDATSTVDARLLHFGAVCRRNGERRDRERREFWTVAEWRDFLAAARACGWQYSRLAQLLDSGASAVDIAVEFGVDRIGARLRANERAQEAERKARLQTARVTPINRRRRDVTGEEE